MLYLESILCYSEANSIVVCRLFKWTPKGGSFKGWGGSYAREAFIRTASIRKRSGIVTMVSTRYYKNNGQLFLGGKAEPNKALLRGRRLSSEQSENADIVKLQWGFSMKHPFGDRKIIKTGEYCLPEPIYCTRHLPVKHMAFVRKQKSCYVLWDGVLESLR